MKMMKTMKMMKRKRNVATFLSRNKTLSNTRRFCDFRQKSQRERRRHLASGAHRPRAGPAPPGSERGWPRSGSVCAPLTQN